MFRLTPNWTYDQATARLPNLNQVGAAEEQVGDSNRRLWAEEPRYFSINRLNLKFLTKG